MGIDGKVLPHHLLNRLTPCLAAALDLLLHGSDGKTALTAISVLEVLWLCADHVALFELGAWFGPSQLWFYGGCLGRETLFVFGIELFVRLLALSISTNWRWQQ